MLIYKHTIEQLTRHLGYPELGEAFEGHLDDPSVLEEYYLWDTPDYMLVRSFLINKISRRWTLDSNVLTIYKDYGNPAKIS